MNKPSLKRTKIIATIGPATRDPETLEELVLAGVNGIRLNMSHGTHAEHAEVVKLVRKISKKLDKPLAIIADLQGPKIRLGKLPEDGVALLAGDLVQFALGDEYKEGGPLPVQHDISPYVKDGQPVFLRDGMMEVKVERVSRGIIYARVVTGGVIFSKQGINLPETDLGGDIMTKKDLADVKFAAENDADYVALSFVQSAHDIQNLIGHLKKHKANVGVIAKIETKAAAARLPEIIEAAEGVMVARGDLAIEIRPEAVPTVQARIIELAKVERKICIVATQMLESMISSPQPTRAEVSDVAGAVMQGADAVMLSGETAMGSYPVETVAMMRRVIKFTESNRRGSMQVSSFGDSTTPGHAIAAAAITLSRQLEADIILAETSSGRTARRISSLRPDAMVVAVSHHPRVYNQMALLWGARAYLIRKPERAAAETLSMLKKEHNVLRGDTIIRVSGPEPGVTGGTNTLQLKVIE